MLRIEQSEILKMFYVLAGPRMLLGMGKSEILKFYVLAGPQMFLHGNSLCSCSLYMAALLLMFLSL